MRFRYVTSMSLAMYNAFGKDMLEGVIKYWPEAEIFCFSEDELPEMPGVKYVNLWTIPGAEYFVKSCSAIPIFRGEIDGKRNYRYDIFSFSKKVFAEIGAAVSFPGYLFWIDADVQTYKPIPAVVLEEWMNGQFMCVMKRKTWHLCSSFVGFDCSHSFAPGFFNHWYQLYLSGKVFILPQWDDAFVLEKCLEGVPGVRDLGEPYTGEGPYNVFDQVFDGYARHLKGNLKIARRYQQLIDIIARMKPGRIIEVGTWNGQRALEMHAASPGLEYFGLDLFEDATQETDAAEKNVKPHYQLDDVQKMLRDAGVWAKLYKGDSKHTFKQYFQEYGFHNVDLIFIDGGHSVETIKSDLENAKKAIKKGGLIVLDDYYTEMPEDELRKVGAQTALVDTQHSLLPAKDSVRGGGKVQMALVQC